MINQFQRLRLQNAAIDIKSIRAAEPPFRNADAEARFERKMGALLRAVEDQIKRESPHLFRGEC